MRNSLVSKGPNIFCQYFLTIFFNYVLDICTRLKSFFQAYEESHKDVLELLKSKGITEITIQPEFPKQNEEDLEDGLKNLIQVNFKNN